MVCAVKTVANTLSIVRLLSQVVSCDWPRWLLSCSQCFPVASASCHLVVVGDNDGGAYGGGRGGGFDGCGGSHSGGG